MREIDRELDSPDPEVRRRATNVIPELPSAEAAGYVVRALGDPDWRVRKEAAQIARLLGPVPALLDRLVDLLFPGENVGLRNAVVETLGAFGRSAVPAVVAVVPKLDADGKKLAAEILGRAQDPSALPVLLRLLDDSDANVRTAAVEAIGDLGGVAVDAASRILVQVLDEGDLHMRLAALEGLNRLGVVIPWEKLRPLVDDPILRRAALGAASRTGHLEAADALARGLADHSPAMFRVALVGLAELALGAEAFIGDAAKAGGGNPWKEHISRLAPRARERLLEAMAPNTQDESENPPVTGDDATRRAALIVAAVVGEPAAIDLAIDALTDDRLSREADAALRLFGSAALPRILARVAHGDASLRAAVIGRLRGPIDPHYEEGVRLALRGSLADSSPEVSSAAFSALGALGGPEDMAVVFAMVVARAGSVAAARASLAELARRFPEDARMTARIARRDHSSHIATSVIIGALGGGVLGAVADDVVFLGGALSSPDPETRMTAVEAVSDVGSHLGMDAILFALADEEREIQLSAVRGLGRLRTPDGRPAGGDRLVELVRESSDPELVATAARALGAARDPRARESLRPLAHSTSPLIAVAAVETLGKLTDPKRIETLLEITGHSHVEVVKAVLLALEKVNDPRALAELGAALSHVAWDVRRLAADCVGRFGGPEASQMLRDKLVSETEPLVRDALSSALGAIEAPETIRRPATIAPPRVDP